MRLVDPSDNGGRGWRRLEREEVAALAYLAIRLIRRSVRKDLAGREASKADEAARQKKVTNKTLRMCPPPFSCGEDFTEVRRENI